MELISSEEAAEILGVTSHRLVQLTREGMLRSKLVSGANKYDPNEVHKLKQIREANLSLAEVAARAARAEMTAYRLERVVTQLLSVIGADLPSADITPEAVVSLHLKVEDAIKTIRTLNVEDVMFWAQTFQSLSEEYFHVVAKEFETEEPWVKYLELSSKLLKLSPFAKLRNDLELHTAYNFLEMSRRSMRQTMFFYVRTTSGKRLAYKLFPEALNDLHADVMSMVSLIAD
jgi:DNA-binding transcriptional MerR regulator